MPLVEIEPLGHILLDGPPGPGKTTFATCIPGTWNDPQIAMAAAQHPPRPAALSHKRRESSVLFIDGGHRLPIAVEEFLYPAMEDFRIDITLGDGMVLNINMPLQPFTRRCDHSATHFSTSARSFVVREHLDYQRRRTRKNRFRSGKT